MIALLSALAQQGGTAAYHLIAGSLRFSFGKESCHGISPAAVGCHRSRNGLFSPAISVQVNTIRCTWKMGDPVEIS